MFSLFNHRNRWLNKAKTIFYKLLVLKKIKETTAVCIYENVQTTVLGKSNLATISLIFNLLSHNISSKIKTIFFYVNQCLEWSNLSSIIICWIPAQVKLICLFHYNIEMWLITISMIKKIVLFFYVLGFCLDKIRITLNFKGWKWPKPSK